MFNVGRYERGYEIQDHLGLVLPEESGCRDLGVHEMLKGLLTIDLLCWFVTVYTLPGSGVQDIFVVAEKEIMNLSLASSPRA